MGLLWSAIKGLPVEAQQAHHLNAAGATEKAPPGAGLSSCEGLPKCELTANPPRQYHSRLHSARPQKKPRRSGAKFHSVGLPLATRQTHRDNTRAQETEKASQRRGASGAKSPQRDCRDASNGKPTDTISQSLAQSRTRMQASARDFAPVVGREEQMFG